MDRPGGGRARRVDYKGRVVGRVYWSDGWVLSLTSLEKASDES